MQVYLRPAYIYILYIYTKPICMILKNEKCNPTALNVTFPIHKYLILISVTSMRFYRRYRYSVHAWMIFTNIDIKVCINHIVGDHKLFKVISYKTGMLPLPMYHMCVILHFCHVGHVANFKPPRHHHSKNWWAFDRQYAIWTCKMSYGFVLFNQIR